MQKTPKDTKKQDSQSIVRRRSQKSKRISKRYTQHLKDVAQVLNQRFKVDVHKVRASKAEAKKKLKLLLEEA